MSDLDHQPEPATPESPRPGRLPRGTMLVVLLGGVAALAVLPFDAQINAAMRAVRPSGLFRQTLEVIQRFGNPVSVALGIVLIALLDRPRLRRSLDWIAAAALSGAGVFVLKTLIGRPRPKHGEPFGFLGPLGTHAVGDDSGARHAWEFWSRSTSELWSMPSNHTSAAVVAGVFLTRLYPRAWPLAMAMCVIVGLCRVWLGAHYPSDVLAGAMVGYLIAHAALAGSWGERVWDGAWARFGSRRTVSATAARSAPR